MFEIRMNIDMIDKNINFHYILDLFISCNQILNTFTLLYIFN